MISKKSAIVNAVKLAAEIRMDFMKIWSKALSDSTKRYDGGSAVASIENKNTKKITSIPVRTTLRARSFPYTSTIISLIVKRIGITNIATLEFRENEPSVNI